MSEKFNFKQRIKGGLEGLVCGDVYGNMTVGYTKDLVIVNYGKPPLKLRLPIPASSLRTTWGLGEVTDDTIQAFTVAKNLIENKKIVINKLFVELKNLPEKFAKSGSSTGKLKLIKNHYCKSFSITNGAAMRVAPIGMAFSIKKKELLLKEVVKASAMTHNSKSSIAGAVAIAFAISAIIDGKSMDEVISLAIEGAILGENYGLKDGLKSMSMEIKKCLNVGYNTYRKDSFSNPDWGFAAIESIPYSIGLLNEFWDCRKAITKAVQYGGDSDTICSIAGALCGTFRPDSVPEEILKCIKSNPFENFLESLYYLRGNQKC